MNHPLKIGLTGGIGSGKSYVASVLEKMGFPVFYSDDEAKKMVRSNIELIQDIEKIIGKKIHSENNQLDKKLLAQELFSHSEKRTKVNELVHPLVRKQFENWSKIQDSSLVFNEAAILFETGAYLNFDAIVLVCASFETKLARIQNRDGSSKEEVIARMASQWRDDEKLKYKPYVIQNDENQPLLIQIESLVQKLKEI